MKVVWLLFFFQAEDGIRDHCVTGVQTCALPISSWAITTLFCAGAFGMQVAGTCDAFNSVVIAHEDGHFIRGHHTLGFLHPCRLHYRSEERRVGKECRSRWSPYH